MESTTCKMYNLLGEAGRTDSAVNGRQVRQQEKNHSYATTHHSPGRQVSVLVLEHTKVRFVKYWADQ